MTEGNRSLFALVVALLLAVVFFQSLGLAHRTLHAFHADSLRVPSVSEPNAAASTAQGAAHGIEALFDSHEATQDCRLFDGHGLHAPALLLPPPPPIVAAARQRIAWQPERAFVPRWEGVFHARAPPQAG